MKKGGKKPAPVPKMVATVGLPTCGPVISIGSKAIKLRDSPKAIEQSYGFKISSTLSTGQVNKSGNYEFITNKAKAKISTGQVYKDKGSGQVCSKNEVKVSSKVSTGQVNKTGNYKPTTNKAKVSTGQAYKDKGSGQVSLKNERKVSSTVKVGNKRGYTERYTEERVRDVSFKKGGGGSGSSKNRIKYDCDY